MKQSRRWNLAQVSILLAVHGALGQQCKLTKADMEGPYFVNTSVPNAQRIIPLNDLDSEHRMDIVGLILNKNCKPVANARVEIWHAGGDHEGTKGHYTFANETFGPELWWRGWVISDDNGYYRFKTIYPTLYTIRPIAHVHYKITTGEFGDAKGKSFITQLYFRDDIPEEYKSYETKDTQFPQKITTYEGEMTIEGENGQKESKPFKHKTVNWNIVIEE